MFCIILNILWFLPILLFPRIACIGKVFLGIISYEKILLRNTFHFSFKLIKINSFLPFIFYLLWCGIIRFRLFGIILFLLCAIVYISILSRSMISSLILSYHIISYHITLIHIMSCHVMLCHRTSYHIILYHIISYYMVDWFFM